MLLYTDGILETKNDADAFFGDDRSYALPVPLSGFLLHLFGEGWRDSMRWVFRGVILCSFTAN